MFQAKEFFYYLSFNKDRSRNPLFCNIRYCITMKKIVSALFSMFTTSCLLVVFAIAIAYATFIENDYGTETAKILIYNAWWFNVLLVATGINLVGGLFYYKAFQLKRWSMVLFHLAFIIILIGAGITRFFSYEGMIHIREGESSNELVSTDTYIQVRANSNGATNSDYWKVNFSPYTLNNFNEDITAGNEDVNVKVADYVPSAVEHIVSDANGTPILSFIILEKNISRQDVSIALNQEITVGKFLVSFEGGTKGADIYIQRSADSLIMRTTDTLSVVSMMGTTNQQIFPGEVSKLLPGGMYQIGNYLFAMKDYQPQGRALLAEATGNEAAMAKDALMINLSSNGIQKQVIVFGSKSELGVPVRTQLGHTNVEVSFGSRLIALPFEIHLNDFQLERYPGSRSPSSFASEVTLIDSRHNLKMPYRIFMNNILDYEGYRFFQSSYDTDEKGTVLSVSHDFWGTAVTYVGYFLMSLGMIFTFFNKKSRFHTLLRASSRLKTLKKKSQQTTILIFLLGLSAFSNSVHAAPMQVERSHVRSFERLLVQDPKGRVEPVNTLASEVLRKLNRKSHFEGMSASEFFLSMSAQPDLWRNIPVIRVANSDLQKQLGFSGKYVSFNQMFDPTTHAYKLRELVDATYKKKPTERNKFDKEVINVDERMNICYQIFKGDFLKVFPDPNDNNHTWVNEDKFYSLPFNRTDSVHLLTDYFEAVNRAIATNNYQEANQKLLVLKDFQHKYGSKIIPGKTKIETEIFYNRFDIFGWLSKICGILGFYLLIIHLMLIFNERIKARRFLLPGTILVALAFVAYTAGLGLRWYVSGHAPWSNGYETLLYVGWATLLSGFVFLKKSQITLAVTTILASLILMVAGLSWMNPEITNLVPVLKSYWLIIHVAVITASYGFLGVAALLGFLNLIIMTVRSKKNLKNASFTIVELAIVIELSMIVGLILLTIGAFIGGVWANESWGRYWGWDPKETWALVTILVYSFIIHLRKVPGLNNHYVLSSLSLVGFSSVLMTFFGVNYYLSGMHSYGQGDAPPVPDFVFVAVVVAIIVVILAGISEKKFGSASKIVKLESNE